MEPRTRDRIPPKFGDLVSNSQKARMSMAEALSLSKERSSLFDANKSSGLIGFDSPPPTGTLTDPETNNLRPGVFTRSPSTGIVQSPLRALLNTIRKTESSLDDRAYTTLNGGGQFELGDEHPNILVPFLDKDGNLAKDEDGNVLRSSATGAYQITKPTYDDFSARTGITGTQRGSQDQMAIAILEADGALDALEAGDFEKAMKIAGRRWVGLGGKLAEDSNQRSGTFDQAMKSFRGFLNGDEEGAQFSDEFEQSMAQLQESMGIEEDVIDVPVIDEATGLPVSPAPPTESDKPVISKMAEIQNRVRENLAVVDTGRNPVLQQSGRDISKFFGYVDGVDPFQDVEKLRALNQSAGEQLWRGTKKLVPNILFGLLENTGQILDIDSWASMIRNDPADFSNWLTKFAKGGKEWVENGDEIFRENPEQVFDIYDPAWYIIHGGQLIESIASFMAVGAGSGFVLGKAAGAVAKGINAGAAVSSGLGATAALGTAATLAYTEGAIEAADVYERRLRQGTHELGMSLPEAQQYAGEGAAKTARINMFNTLVNITAVAPFFRKIGTANALSKSQFGRLDGEILPAYLKRLDGLAGQPKAATNLLRANFKEIPQEMTEEMWNEFASAEGMVVGTGDKRTFSERLTDVLAKPETRLAALLGGLGGAGQTNISQLTPLPSKVRQEDGTFKTVYESAYSKEKAAEDVLFNKTRNDIRTRAEQYQKDMRDIEDSSTSLDPDRETKYRKAQNSLFGLAAKDNVKRGIEDQLIQDYQNIADLEPEAALQQGFDTDPDSDTYYKKLAQKKISETKKLVKIWANAEQKYGFNDEESLSGLPTFVFDLEYAVTANKDTLDTIGDLTRKATTEATEQMEARGIDPVLASILIRRAALSDVNHLTAEDIMEEVEDDLTTDAGRQRVNNLYGTESISDISKIVERQVDERLVSTAKDEQQLQDDIFAYADANELAADLESIEAGGENVNDRLSNLTQDNADVLGALGQLGQLRADFTRDFLTASRALSNITSGTGRKNFIESFRREVAILMDQNAENIKDAVNEADTKQEVDAIAADVTDPETSEEVAPDIAQKKADFDNDEARAISEIDGPVGAPKFESDETQAQVDADIAEEDLNRGFGNEPVSPDPIPQLAPDKREQALASILEETNAEEAFDIFDWFQLNFTIDGEFRRAAEAHIENLRRSEDGLVPPDQAQLVDVADRAHAELETSPHNISRNKQSLSDRLSEDAGPKEFQTDSKGAPMRSGFRVVPAASALAFRSRDFVRTFAEDGTPIILTSSNQRAADTTPEVESLRFLRPGSEVRIEVDLSEVDALIKEHGDNASDFVKIEVQQKVDGDWKRMAWVHTPEWINASLPNDPNKPLNVAHTVKGVDNWAVQKAEIAELRKWLWENRESPVVTTITSRAIGHLSRNLQLIDGEPSTDADGRQTLEYGLLNQLIPDPKVEFYIMTSGEYRVKFGKKTDKFLLNNVSNYETGMEGQVGILIPMGRATDGEVQYMATPVWIPRLKESQVDSVWGLMEAFWANPLLAQNVRNATELTFDPQKNKKDLAPLLENYLFSRWFTEKVMVDRKTQLGKILFHVGSDSGHVRMAKTGTNVMYSTNPKHAGRKNGVITHYIFQPKVDGSPGFEHQAAVMDLLSEMTLQVDLNKLNQNGEIKDVIFETGNVHMETPGYTDFLKDNLSTNINGTNTVFHSDGSVEYTYSVGATTTFDTSFIRPALSEVQLVDPVDPEASEDPLDSAFGPRDKSGTEDAVKPEDIPDDGGIDMREGMDDIAFSMGSVDESFDSTDSLMDQLEENDQVKITCKIKG